MKIRFLIIFAAVLALASFPAIAAANGAKTFSASGTVTRTAAGAAAIDPSTGGLLTTGQVFMGNLTSSWKGLDGAGITVIQNSLIGLDPVALGTTGVSPLFGQAWGTFDIADRKGRLAGAYSAWIEGTLYLDPFGAMFGCQATSVLGPIDINGDGLPDPVGAFVEVSDTGTWQVTPDSATGNLKRIDEVGGLLMAVARGCLEGSESADMTLTGRLVSDDDDERGEGKDRGKGDRDDDDNRGRGERDDDDDNRGRGERNGGDDAHDRGERGSDERRSKS